MKNLRKWELLYTLFSSSFDALIFIFPIIFTIISVGSYLLGQSKNLVVLIGACILVFIISGVLKLIASKEIQSLKIAVNETVEMLKEDRNSKIAEIAQRSARIYPDEGKIALGEYNKLIQSIQTKGYYDFECEVFSPPDTSKPILLFVDTPGMSKIYFVAGQNTSHGIKLVFRLLNPDDVDLRDFAVTWFGSIFRILGNTCRGISELQSGYNSPNDEIGGDFYCISKYRFFTINKIDIFRIYID